MSPRIPARPVVLRAWEVRAVLAGSKTALRVPFLTQPMAGWNLKEIAYRTAWFCGPKDAPWLEDCHLGMPGTHLWVRESAYIAPKFFGSPSDGNVRDPEGVNRVVGYAASMDPDAIEIARNYGVKLTQGSSMPRWSSRLLQVTNIQAQRVQDVTHEEAVAEGAHQKDTGLDAEGQPLANWSSDWPHPRNHECCWPSPRLAALGIWKRRFRWSGFDEWTWRISFKVVPTSA